MSGVVEGKTGEAGDVGVVGERIDDGEEGESGGGVREGVGDMGSR